MAIEYMRIEISLIDDKHKGLAFSVAEVPIGDLLQVDRDLAIKLARKSAIQFLEMTETFSELYDVATKLR